MNGALQAGFSMFAGTQVLPAIGSIDWERKHTGTIVENGWFPQTIGTSLF
jgi:hypothetical protein